MAPTFRDAITVASELGIQYIWIDSLCIIQDSSSDWERESKEMGTVYSNSTVNIGAACAKDGSAGFLLPRPKPAYLPYRISQSRSSRVWSGRIWIRPRFLSSNMMHDGGFLGDRAWVVQEKLLAPRAIFFNKTSVAWKCREKKWIEGRSRNFSDYGKSGARAQRDTDPFSGFYTAWIEAATGKRPSTNVARAWRFLVENYTRTKLTVPTDKLPALSGLAAQVQAITNDKYLAGLWRSDMPRNLMWEGYGRNPNPNLPYRAPSWSWVSTDLQARYPPCISKPNCVDDLEIIDARTTVKGENTFGEVEGGYLTVRGLLKPAKLSVQPMNTPSRSWKVIIDFGISLEIERRQEDLPSHFQNLSELYILLVLHHRSDPQPIPGGLGSSRTPYGADRRDGDSRKVYIPNTAPSHTRQWSTGGRNERMDSPRTISVLVLEEIDRSKLEFRRFWVCNTARYDERQWVGV